MPDAQAPSFLRVLTGASCGAMLGAAAWMAVTGEGGLDRLMDPDVLYMALPFGAILGMRWATGRGGTARWVVLLGSYLTWFASVFLLRQRGDPWFFNGGPVGIYLALPAFLGGWAALTWRSLCRLSGGTGPHGSLAPCLVGLWVTELLWVGAVWFIATASGSSFGLSGRQRLDWLVFAVIPIALAVILVLALSCLGSWVGNLDVPWAKAVLAAVLIGEAVAVSRVMVSLAGWSERASWVFPVQWMLFRIAWFSWWAHRLTRDAEALPPSVDGTTMPPS